VPQSQPPIYVINLDRAADRWRDMRSELAAAGLTATRFAGVDGKAEAEAVTARFAGARSVYRLGRRMNLGELGCFASHYKLWQEIAAAGHTAAIVLEDDLVFGPKAAKAVAQAAPLIEEYGYLRLAALEPTRKLFMRDLPEGFRQMFYIRGPRGTQAYGLSAGAAASLVERAQRWDRPVDEFLDCSWLHGLPGMALEPYQFVHREEVPSHIALLGKEVGGAKKATREVFRLYDQTRRLIWNLRQRRRYSISTATSSASRPS